MPSLFSIAASAALLVPAFGMGVSAGESAPVNEASSKAQSDRDLRAGTRTAGQALDQAGGPIRQFRRHAVWRQTRIEQRVIIRISPQRTSGNDDLLSRLPRRSLNARYVERKTDKCLAVDGIAGVQTGSGNRLLLFLRDKKIISINLEKACRARDFYSGFYVEKNEDGKLCVKRDRLHSRNGVKCEVQRMRQLVAVTE